MVAGRVMRRPRRELRLLPKLSWYDMLGCREAAGFGGASVLRQVARRFHWISARRGSFVVVAVVAGAATGGS